MPRTRALGVPEKQKEIAEDLAAFCGSRMMMIKDVMRYMGFTNYETAHRFLDGIPGVRISEKNRKWNVMDIARKIYEKMEV